MILFVHSVIILKMNIHFYHIFLFKKIIKYPTLYICDPMFSDNSDELNVAIAYKRIGLFTYIREQLFLIRPLNSN